MLKPVQTPENSSLLKSYATLTHEPCSYAYKIVSQQNILDDEKLKTIRLYRGKDVAKSFVSRLRADVEYLWTEYMTKNLPMVITKEQENDFQSSTNCYICDREFQESYKNGPICKTSRVRDHDHILGNFLLINISIKKLINKLFF